MSDDVRRRLPGWLLPITVAVVGGLGLLWLRPSIITAGITSWRAWLFGGLVLAAAVLLPRGVRAVGGPRWLGRSAAVLPVIAALAWTVLPAFRNTTVNEPLAAEVTTVQPTPTPTETSPAASATPMPTSEALIVGTAPLRGIGHRATGTARLIRLPNGSYLVRLEKLSVEAGPDFLVYLVPGAGREKPNGGTQLARLKANRGNQSYPVPAGTTVRGPQSVLIWCRAFAVPVASATLT